MKGLVPSQSFCVSQSHTNLFVGSYQHLLQELQEISWNGSFCNLFTLMFHLFQTIVYFFLLWKVFVLPFSIQRMEANGDQLFNI